jgi:2-hydroxychromene-2-carboxylate isomerase
VCGVPTFFNDGEMFFGNDRLDFVKARLEPAWRPNSLGRPQQ